MKQNYFSQIVKALVIIIALIALGYGAYQLYYFAIDVYNAAVENATQKIRAGVSSGVQEGVGKSLNPVKMFKGIFGGNKQQQ